jgi:uncharacterized hydrophobic protein (TIGR00271 family)
MPAARDRVCHDDAMLHALRVRMLPESQRRTLDELTGDLDLNEGDTRAKRSAYWTMLLLSACVASAGVIADSTATVIGAMIIAPLSTPIMGTALSIVKRERTGALRYVFFGALIVIVIGAVFALLLPGRYDLVTNGQVSGRTSPSMVDLIAAIATGFAGAIALARKDVAAILPGVAIAISLVPPLSVVGICLGQGAPSLAFGALVLFLSNFLSLVFAGSFVFTTLGYTGESRRGRGRRAKQLTWTALTVLVLVPLAGNSLLTLAYSRLEELVTTSAEQWVSAANGAELVGVDHQGLTVTIRVSAPGDLPPTSELKAALDGDLPPGFVVVLERTVGERVDLGTTT